MQKVYVAKNPITLDQWSFYETTDIKQLLIKLYPSEFPSTGRIYCGRIQKDCEVTPKNQQDIERLSKLQDNLYVIVMPAGPIAITLGVVLGVGALVAASFLLQPKLPAIATNRNRQTESPNNQLSDRTNQARLNSRIPDIFGEVRSTPDLIAVPYRIYDNHREVEISYMCVGKGEYEVSSIKDGETLISQIEGASVEVYSPNTSPNNTSSPQIRIGDTINEDVVKVTELNSVNGQTLLAENQNTIVGENNIRFSSPNTIERTSTLINFDDFFEVNDNLVLSNSSFSENADTFTIEDESANFNNQGEIIFQSYNPSNDFQVGDDIRIIGGTKTNGMFSGNFDGVYEISSVNSTTITLDNPQMDNSSWSSVGTAPSGETGFSESDFRLESGIRSGDLNGTYTIQSITNSLITLNTPSSINSDWDKLSLLVNDMTSSLSPTLSKNQSDNWVGPFFIDLEDLNQVYCNFVALNGLYKDSGSQQTSFDVTVEIELTPADSDGNTIGSPETFQGTILGSSISTSTRALTMEVDPNFTGRCQIRARRITDTDLNFNGNVSDEIKWERVYGVAPISETDFGDVTTVFSKTFATQTALAVKERKLNMVVQRKLPSRISGSDFTTTLTATKSADDILSFICLDPHIGNRQKSEIDFDSIYNTISSVKSYFGFDECGEFCYTFDEDNLSFEETIATITEATFTIAFRLANQIRLKAELKTNQNLLIFNHRNKIPNTESRAISFGNNENNDGVELEYVSPIDGVTETLSLPENKNLINPRKIETIGIRNKQQAYFLAWRIWNKIQYQNTTVEFDCTQEGAMLSNNDRVLVSDNTRPTIQEGEVLSQSGLILTLSQDVNFEPNKDYYIYLQHVDATTEVISVTAGSNSNQVILSTSPSQNISTNPQNYAKCTYLIQESSSGDNQSFLILEKESKSNFEFKLSGINYDPIYYERDCSELILNFKDNNFKDNNLNRYEPTIVGNPTIVNDPQRGLVYQGSSTSYLRFTTLTASDSYTKMCWVNKPDNINRSAVINSINGSTEFFHITSSNTVTAGHNNLVSVSSDTWVGIDTWGHVAVTYNSESGKMNLYINGELVDSENVPVRTLEELSIFGVSGNNISNHLGKADNLHYYSYSMTDKEIKRIYQSTIL